MRNHFAGLLALLTLLHVQGHATAHPAQGGGHQITPAINEYLVVLTDPGVSGQFGATGIPTVVEVNSEYMIAFKASVNSGPTGIYYWDTSMSNPMVGPALAFSQGQSVSSIETATTNTSGAVGNIEAGTPPAISTAGHIAQIAGLPVGGGVVRFDPTTGQSTVACNTNQPINGHTYLVNAVTRPISISTSGTVGFHCSIKTSGGSSAGNGIFRDAAVGLDKVAATGDAADNTAGSFTFVGGSTQNIREQQWNSSNNPAFYGTTNSSPPGATGIWVETSSGVINVARSGDTPWITGGSAWTGFDSPSINELGDVAFRACTSFACGGVGLWAKIGGTQTLIAVDGDVAPTDTGAPGIPIVEQFTDFDLPVINAQGHVAFWAEMNNGHEGIWIMDGTGQMGMRRIVEEGEQVRGTSLTFATLPRDIALADSGQVAFLATLSDGSEALFVESEYFAPIKLARQGENFPLPGGGGLQIQNVVFYPGASTQGIGGLYRDHQSSLNSTAVAYQLTFTTSESAVVLTTVGP